MPTYPEKLITDIALIGENYFIDPEVKVISGKEFLHWNTTLLVLSYVLDANPLIVGEPGFAKTTAAKVIASVMSGLPFDLYEAAQIQGHPDQTFETMIARPDFSKLAREESVIWLLSAYLQVRIIDEINRLPTGKQDELLNALQTGRFNYLNATFFSGRTPFFATANHPDDGNHILIPPIRDRFTISLELGHIGASYRKDIRRAKENIAELCQEPLTCSVIGLINDKSISIVDKLKRIQQEQSKFARIIESEPMNGHVFSAEDRINTKQEIWKVPLTSEAEALLQIIDSELNNTYNFGRKRSNDPIDSSNHAFSLASTKTHNAFSPRGALDGLEDYAKALAYLGGVKEVNKDYLVAIAPHILGHRLEFTNDFAKLHNLSKREGMYGCTREMHLSQKLVKEVELNYASVKADLDLLMIYQKEKKGDLVKAELKLTEALRARAEELMQNSDLVDHPLLKEYIGRLNSGR
ncbi:AAA family ATPase [Candidatus Woesearchaeota archaeon]|nr:AAA family ATPase [Candidatus Woesearchaeota archaeon]